MGGERPNAKQSDDEKTRAYIQDMTVQLARLAAKIGDVDFANALLAIVEQSAQPSRH